MVPELHQSDTVPDFLTADISFHFSWAVYCTYLLLGYISKLFGYTTCSLQDVTTAPEL